LGCGTLGDQRRVDRVGLGTKLQERRIGAHLSRLEDDHFEACLAHGIDHLELVAAAGLDADPRHLVLEEEADDRGLALRRIGLPQELAAGLMDSCVEPGLSDIDARRDPCLGLGGAFARLCRPALRGRLRALHRSLPCQTNLKFWQLSGSDEEAGRDQASPQPKRLGCLRSDDRPACPGWPSGAGRSSRNEAHYEMIRCYKVPFA